MITFYIQLQTFVIGKLWTLCIRTYKTCNNWRYLKLCTCLGWLTHFVSGEIFSPRVLIYPNTFIQGQYVYNIILNILSSLSFTSMQYGLELLGASSSWSYGSWIYNYRCIQCIPPLMLWVRISIRARCTTLCDKVCQWLVTGRWFSPGTPVSSINKTDRHDI